MKIWILTEERPRAGSLVRVLEWAYGEAFACSRPAVRPIVSEERFQYRYRLDGVSIEGVEEVLIELVRGTSSFVDHLVFRSSTRPPPGAIPDYAVEETKTDPSESRNTHAYQRLSKFAYLSAVYAGCGRLDSASSPVAAAMMYSPELPPKRRTPSTAVFGATLLDGCPHTFDELAREVLPRRMNELRSSIASPISMTDFTIAGKGPKTLAKQHGHAADFSGCYVLLENGSPVYAGISRHVFERLLQHVRPGDHMTATLAYRMAAHEAPHGKRAKEAMADLAFRAHFDDKRAYLQSLDVALVRIDNPLELYLFEAYCAMELQTGLDRGCWNTFITH